MSFPGHVSRVNNYDSSRHSNKNKWSQNANKLNSKMEAQRAKMAAKFERRQQNRQEAVQEIMWPVLQQNINPVQWRMVDDRIDPMMVMLVVNTPIRVEQIAVLVMGFSAAILLEILN